MGDARILLLIGVSFGWLPACREDSPMPAGTTAAPTRAHEAGTSRWLELAASNTALDALLAEHAQRAAEQGLKPALYIGASWCQPCKILKEHRDDPRVASALRGTYTIEIDLDDWTVAELSASGYEVQAVPVFFAIGAGGKAAGPRLDGGAWGGADADAEAEQIAGAFEGFFHQ
jgi:thiol:disulfide interchange protein